MSDGILRGILIFTTSLLIACADLNVRRGESPAGSDAGKEVQVTSFLFGFIPASKVYQSELCSGSRIESMRLHMSGSDVGLALITFGVYTPQHLTVICTKN